jgi:hypothetical protein
MVTRCAVPIGLVRPLGSYSRPEPMSTKAHFLSAYRRLRQRRSRQAALGQAREFAELSTQTFDPPTTPAAYAYGSQFTSYQALTS